MAFPHFSFVYQSFIPQSVGRPLTEIFRGHPYLNRQDLVNYDEFMNFLRQMDTNGRLSGEGGTWIAEPPPFSTIKGTFAMTNDGEFATNGTLRRHTTNKVRIEGSIDLREIGQMSPLRPPIQVPPAVRAFQCRAAIVPQTSNLNVGYPGVRLATGKYVGVYEYAKPAISHISGSVHVENKSEGTYLTRPGTPVTDLFDTTIVTIRASGSYPFVLMAPNIDMFLTIKLRRQGGGITITFEGRHDQFPAYELLVNGVSKRQWNPVAHGQFGPNPINLNANYLNTQVRTSYVHYERLPYGYNAPRKTSPFGAGFGKALASKLR